LVVYDNGDQPSTANVTTVTVVTGTPPTAVAGGPYLAATDGPPAYFNGLESSDDADPFIVQGIAKYLWDVDIATDSDGDMNPSNDIDLLGPLPFHVYTNAGVYTARLTVVDGIDQQDSDLTVITVTNNLPPDVTCVAYLGDDRRGHPIISGQPTTLKGTVRDAGALTYQWDFGDGSPRFPAVPGAVPDPFEIDVTHTYTGPVGKPFVAELIVWDAAGLSNTDRYFMVIQPDILPIRSEIAIQDGLWVLHKNQDRANGYWLSPYGNQPRYRGSSAASALLAFQVNGHGINSDPQRDAYVETVRKGFDFMYTYIDAYPIGIQAGFDPDSNGNGIGISLDQTISNQEGYESGIIMDAIAASQELLAMAGTGKTNVKHRFFFDILTDMVDMYAWGQVDSGNNTGGWRYGFNTDSDNSACQWGAIGLLAAQDIFGINIPEFVKVRNLQWLNYTHSGTWFGYNSPNQN
ncbi:MAG: PKD domain-containing protein, partial [Verrucomicrobiota bacterium]